MPPLAPLTRADCAVDADIRRAETLPPAAFVDPAFLARELETVFRASWQLVPDRADADDPRPLLEQVGARGSRVPLSIHGRPVFLQRGWDDDALRLFPNSCTHAWYRLVPGPSRGPTLVCAQHGRRFDCAGRFVSQPGFGKDVADFPRACDHLASLPVEAWRQLVFALPAPGAPAVGLGELLAPVDASLARFPTALERVVGAGEVRDVAGNWKQHAWNYLDRFHVAFVHRAPGGLADVIDMATYTTELHGDAVLQWAYASDPADGFDPALLPERFADAKGRRVFALWWFVFPNLTLNYYPWGLSVNLYAPVPGKPDTTRFHWYHWVLDRAAYAERDRRWLSAQVDAEDLDALAQVSRGLLAPDAPRGRFAPAEEQAAHWFHRRVSAAAFPVEDLIGT
jgi:choline monooxygenase